MEFANPDRTDPPEYLELLLDGSNVYHKKSLGKSTFKFGKINHEWIQAVKLESRYKACINIAKNQGHPEKQCLTYSIGWCLCCIHSKEQSAITRSRIFFFFLFFFFCGKGKMETFRLLYVEADEYLLGKWSRRWQLSHPQKTDINFFPSVQR